MTSREEFRGRQKGVSRQRPLDIEICTALEALECSTLVLVQLSWCDWFQAVVLGREEEIVRR